MAFKLTPK